MKIYPVIPSYIGLYLLFAISLCGCTYNVSLVHTEGQASDIIDTEQSPTNDIKPTVQIPIKPL